MKVQQTDIYHCLKCGRVVYQDHTLPPPTCCGEEMTRAAFETTPVDEGEQPDQPPKRSEPDSPGTQPSED